MKRKKPKEKPAAEKKTEDTLEYKGLTFKVKPNVLGVCDQLLDVQDRLEEEEYINTLWIVKLEEYTEYKRIIYERLEIEKDLETAKVELKKAKDNKKWREVIAADEKALRNNENELMKPGISNTATLYSNKLKSVRAKFTTNRENIKIICMGLLEGEVNGIDFEDNSNEFWAFVSKVWLIFFSISRQIRQSLIL